MCLERETTENKSKLNKWKYGLCEGDYISFLIWFIKNKVERQLSVPFHRQFFTKKNCRTGTGTEFFMVWKEAIYGAGFSSQVCLQASRQISISESMIEICRYGSLFKKLQNIKINFLEKYLWSLLGESQREPFAFSTINVFNTFKSHH